MGTSKSYGGPQGPQPLLPPWAQNPDDTNPPTRELPPQDSEPSVVLATPSLQSLPGNWRAAKSSITRLVGNHSKTDIRRAATAHIRSHGGSQNAARSAVSIGHSSRMLAAFIGDVSRKGLDSTLRSIGLQECIGKSTEFVLAKVLDYLAPSGDTNEEADARRAILDTLSELYDRLDLSIDGLSKLNALSENDLKSALLTCIGSYIFVRWIQELGISIESKKISESQALSLEREMKAYIKERVAYDFGSRSLTDMDFLSKEGRLLVDNILLTAYQLIEK